MPKLIVVNPWHWLHEDGSFPEEPRLRKRTVRVAQCIEYGATLGIGESRATLISCRGRGCAGFMIVLKQNDEAIQSFCDTCTQDEFLIYEWEDTPWARGPGVALHVDHLVTSPGFTPKPPRAPGPGDLTLMLERCLALLGSSLSAIQVRDLIARSDHPGTVAEAVMDSISGPPPTKGAVERFLPVLMNVWNETQRDDLGGRSPSQAYQDHRPSSPPDPGRPLNLGLNAPCACGSGKKFKRCCMSDKAN